MLECLHIPALSIFPLVKIMKVLCVTEEIIWRHRGQRQPEFLAVVCVVMCHQICRCEELACLHTDPRNGPLSASGKDELRQRRLTSNLQGKV